MTPAYVFVGENRSTTAREKAWTWRDGRLAAKPLFEALRAIGVDPLAQDFMNLWTDDGFQAGRGRVPWQRVSRLREALAAGSVVVALGSKVAAALAARGVAHVPLVHPAARGRIRAKHRYRAHVRARLAVAP